MAFLDILIPQLMNGAQNCEQAFGNLMDQDWNHWKLQFQSYMDDINESEGTPSGPSAAGCGQRCGPSSGQSCGRANTGCGRRSERSPTHPLEALHQIWNQFNGAGHQQQRSGGQRATNNVVDNASNKKFTVKLDVENYEPNEIEVKIVDRDIVVTAEHAERTDRLGRVSRRFQRKFELPAEVEAETIVSTMTASGVLIIEGLKKSTQTDPNAEVIIPVVREGDNSAEPVKVYENDQQMD